MSHPLRSLKRQLLALVVGPFAVVLAIGAGTIGSHFGQRLDAERRSNVEMARAVATAFQAYVEGVREESAVLGRAILLVGRPEDATRLLQEAALRRGSVRAFAWVMPDGTVRHASDPSLVGASVADRPEFRAAVAGSERAVGNLLPSRAPSEFTFGIAEPIHGADGRLAGVVLASVDAERLDDHALRLERVGNAGYALVDATGRLVMRTPRVERTWAERDLSGIDLVRRALAGEEASGDTPSLATGETWIGAAIPIRRLGWVARSGRSRAEVIGPISEDLVKGGVWALLAATLALLASAVTSRRIVLGLVGLERHVEALGRGEPSGGAIGGPEEVERLGRAFDDMSARLLAASGARDRLNADLERQRAFFEKTFRAAPAGMVVVDGATLRVRWANPAFLALLDEPHRSTGIAGLRVDDFVPNARESGLVAVFERVAAEGMPYEHPRARLEGLARGTAWFSWSLRPVPALGGGGTDLLLLVSDITEQVARLEATERAVRNRDEVLAVVSHDLRTPLGTIVMGSAALVAAAERGDPPRARVLANAARIRGAGERMSRMVDDLLDLASLEEGRLALAPAPCAPDELVREAVEQARAAAEEKGLELGWEAPSDLPRVSCDAGRVLQVLGNLVSNAVKAAETGWVCVRAAEVDGEVRIEVADSGPGIAPEDLPHVFDRFRRGQDAAYRGTGLGLAISRGIVDAHGGRIWAESRLGHGTRVFFTLPRAERAAATHLRPATGALR